MGRHTTIAERKLVIHHAELGKSQRKIAEILNITRSAIQKIILRHKTENRICNKTKNSEKKIFTERDEKWLLRQVADNPKLSAPKLAEIAEKYLKKKCNPETIRRILRKHGLHGRVALKKPFINPKNRQIRLEFVQEHEKKDFEFWKTVIFADESKFNMFGSDGPSKVWRRANTALNPKHTIPTVKHGGGSVMVWGCMSAAGVGNLVFIEGIMDKMCYLNILRDNLKCSAEKLGLGTTFQFYQDNDPKHKSHIVREWMLYNCPKVIQTPPQYPDLNPIENLWSILETNIRSHNISSIGSLKNALQEEWRKIQASCTENLVKSMPKRLKAVKNNKGYHTKY